MKAAGEAAGLRDFPEEISKEGNRFSIQIFMSSNTFKRGSK